MARGKQPGPWILGIIAALDEHGELTLSEIAKVMSVHRRTVSSVLSRMNRPLASVPKRVFIKYWVEFDTVSTHRYPRPVYALGSERDAPGPKSKDLERERQRRKRHTTERRVASVFDLGLTRAQKRGKRSQIKDQYGAQPCSTEEATT